ncbi:triose-phosphate isomerase, partial [uncultured Gilliamella sp.]
MRKPLVMGNWKLNGSIGMAKDLVTGLRNELSTDANCGIAIAPPSVYLDFVAH